MQIMAHETVDLVLLDMNMPDLDGLATFRGIRSLGGTSSRVITVAMTADVLPAQLARIAAEGLDGCLKKPLSQEALNTLLHRHFGG